MNRRAKGFSIIALILTIIVSLSILLPGCGFKNKNVNYGRIDPKKISFRASSTPRKSQIFSNIAPKTVAPAQSYKPLNPNGNHYNFTDLKDPQVELVRGNIEFQFIVLTQNNEEKTIQLTGQLNEMGDAFLTSEKEIYIKGFLSCVEMKECSELYVDIFVFPNIKRLRQFVVSSPMEKVKKVNDKEEKPKIIEAPKVEVQNEKDLVAVIDSHYFDNFEHGEGEKGEYVGRSFSDDLWADVRTQSENIVSQPVENTKKEKEPDPINSKNKGLVDEQQTSSDESSVDNTKQQSAEKVELVAQENTEESREETGTSEQDQADQLVDLPQEYLYNVSGGVSIRTTNNGELKNGIKIQKSGPGFKSLRVATGKNDKVYGSGVLIDFISKQAEKFNSIYSDEEIYVNSLSYKEGGEVAKHSSHQNGLDMDISYLPGPQWKFGTVLVNSKNVPVYHKSKKCSQYVSVSSGFDFERNFSYIKKMTDSGLVLRIFVNCEIKEAMCKWAKNQGEKFFKENKKVLYYLRPESRHDDHMHVRLKCPAAYEKCRNYNPIELPEDPGC